MRDFGVKVSVIEPGFFRTQIVSANTLENSLISAWERLPEEIKAAYGEKYMKERKYLHQRVSSAVSRPEARSRRVPPPRHPPMLRARQRERRVVSPQTWRCCGRRRGAAAATCAR